MKSSAHEENTFTGQIDEFESVSFLNTDCIVHCCMHALHQIYTACRINCMTTCIMYGAWSCVNGGHL